MVVKDRRGRFRYIVFEIEPGRVRRRDMIHALNRASSERGLRPSPRLTVFDGRMGIVRCGHMDRDMAVRILNSINEIGGSRVEVRSIRTSGTIRKAKESLD